MTNSRRSELDLERKESIDGDEHRNGSGATLTGWVEPDGIIVSLWSDFVAGRTYGFQYFTDGSVRKLVGAITVKA